jgi:hypothetical protein
MLLVGPSVAASGQWLERADITSGPILRAIGSRGSGEREALAPQSIKLSLSGGARWLDWKRGSLLRMV